MDLKTKNSMDFDKASFKDFENISGLDAFDRAVIFSDYLKYRTQRGQHNYRLESMSGCGPEMQLLVPGLEREQPYVSLVSNDYLGFTRHPKVTAAAVAGIRAFGAGAGASPAIGGHFSFHRELEEKIARFFQRESAIIYTTGYTANSATLQCLLKKEDIAILDSGVHTSVQEGCMLTNIKTFPHNDTEALERVLKAVRTQYRMKLVVVDGVYSQDGDLAPLDRILELVRHYGAYLLVDDAHGTGVIGKTGRGVIEQHNLLQEVDIITGTFSKSFGHVGGYVVARPDLIDYLKFQSRQHLFSASLPPPAMSILKAIDLVDEEPFWIQRLWDNVHYLRAGLTDLGLDTGNTASAIVPVKIGDMGLNAQACRLLLQAGVYTNQINYPAVALKDSRIRMSLMATHTKEQMNEVLNAWEWVIKKLELRRGEARHY
jgi:glycine C-acetyltransferase